MTTESDLLHKLDLVLARLESLEKCQAEATARLSTLVLKHEKTPDDGPEPPDRLWLDGVRFDGFTTRQYGLLECLWGRSAVSITDVMEHVWGDDEDRDNSLKKLVHRVNEKLAKKGIPLTVVQTNQQLHIVT